MAIAAIIVTSLSYALQMSVSEYVCNAERFDNKACPFVGSIMETILRMQMGSETLCQRRWIVTNGLMCGSTVRKFHGVAFGSRSEITKLKGPNGVRTFKKKLELLIGT